MTLPGSRLAWLAGPKDVAILLILITVPAVAPGTVAALGFVAVQYVFFALGLTILVGWVGLLDLGAAGFIAVGAYATAIGLTEGGWPALAVLLVAAIAGAAAGVLLGLPTLRHRADYFAILTLGFAELVAQGIRNWPAVTRGAYGYTGIPATTLPGLDAPLRAVPPVGYYYYALAVAVPAFFAVLAIRETRWGRACHIVKHSEAVAACYGISVFHTKLLAFAISSTLLAIGGYFWTVYQRAITWAEFGITLSCLLIAAVVVGGVGNPRGAVLGAALLGTGLEVLRRVLTEYGLPQNVRFLVFAVALVTFVHLRPRGLLPDQPDWRPTSGCAPQPITPPANGFVLRAEQVTKHFGGVTALDGVTVTVSVGECVALIGPNGSGKTTLLNLLTGTLRPDGGAVTIGGQRVDQRPPHHRARLGIGRSFQEVSVFDDLSVGGNVTVAGPDATAAEIATALRAFGLPAAETPTAELSYGARKALDLARLFARPSRWRVVLLDEPTAGLTQRDAVEMVRSLEAVRKSTRMGVLVVSHDVLFLESLGVDRVVVLDRGRVCREGSLADVRADPAVQALFWGLAGSEGG